MGGGPFTSPVAPCSIHSETRPSCSLVSGGAFTLLFAGGMISTFGSDWVAALISRLSAGLPATAAGPVSPPLRMSAGVSSTRPALGLVLLWQARQELFSSG